MNEERATRHIIIALIQFVIALVGIGVLHFIISALPMTDGLPNTANIGIDIALNTLTAAIVVWLGWQLRYQLPTLVSRFTAIGSIAFSITVLISLIILYNTLYDITTSALGDQAWIYSVIFLIAALIALIIPIYLAFQNIGMLASSAADQVNRLWQHQQNNGESLDAMALQGIYCNNCSTVNNDEAQYCSSCGEELSEPRDQNNEMVCDSCGELYAEADVYCKNCGSRLPVTRNDNVKSPSQEEENREKYE